VLLLEVFAALVDRGDVVDEVVVPLVVALVTGTTTTMVLLLLVIVMLETCTDVVVLVLEVVVVLLILDEGEVTTCVLLTEDRLVVVTEEELLCCVAVEDGVILPDVEVIFGNTEDILVVGSCMIVELPGTLEFVLLELLGFEYVLTGTVAGVSHVSDAALL